MKQEIENALNKLKESGSGDLNKAKAIAVAEHVIQSADRFAVNASKLGKLYRKRIFQPKNRAPKRRVEKLKATVKLFTSHYFDAVQLCMLMSQPVPKTTFISGGRAAGKTEAIHAWIGQVKETFKDRYPADNSVPSFSFKANLTPDQVKALQTMNTEPEKMKINMYEVKDDNTVVGPISGEMLKRDWDKLQGMAGEE